MGQAERLVLGDVGDLDPEPRAVADRRLDLGAGVADDDADLGDAGRGHVLDAVEQDRLVCHRYQLLGAGVGDRAQARAGAAGEDEALHAADKCGTTFTNPTGSLVDDPAVVLTWTVGANRRPAERLPFSSDC